ncbi:MAG TPA: hypothetical protein VHT05_04175 [Candidatus Elarobacter sp.]|jgi:hypothetical protein|nr:hypothetical protein [Candidatus Elarobacter sp.]
MDGPNHSRNVATLGSALIRVVTALCAVVALFAGAAAAASAQSSPAPMATPAGSTNPGPGSTPGNTPANAGGVQTVPAKPLPPVSHLPIIDLVTTFTQPNYYGSAANVKGYDPVDVGGTVRIPVTRKLSLNFDRLVEGTLNQPLECVLQPSAPGGVAARVCPNDSRDVILQYHATYAFDRHFTADLGDSFRHREWNSGASGVSSVPFMCDNGGNSTGSNCTVSSTEHHYGYLGLSYTTSPIHEFFNSSFVFSETGDMQNVDHHIAVLCTTAAQGIYGSRLTCPTGVGAGAVTTGNGNYHVGYLDGNPNQSVYYETTQGITWILPIDARHGTTFTLNDRWGALNFYENSTFIPAFGTTTEVPYRWATALTYQLNKRFSPGFTLSLRHSDYHSEPQGSPFVAPNAIHVGSWDVIGTFHIDTNSWFH